MIELLNQALERRMGLFIFHAHGEEGQVQMSWDDRNSASQLLPKFQLVAPDRPHGSLVIGPDSAAGMILMPAEDIPTESFSLRLLDDRMLTWPIPPATQEERVLFQRQPITSNPLLGRVLGVARVAVVGLSGGGSQIVPQLARCGIGEIIGIDDQRADSSNLFATAGISWLDALLRRKKTSIMKSRVWFTNRRVRFTGITARVPEKQALDVLKRADIIVGCVNNLHARADLMDIAWRYCIPYVDIGMVIKTSDDTEGNPKPITAIAGNVFTAIPGGPLSVVYGIPDR